MWLPAYRVVCFFLYKFGCISFVQFLDGKDLEVEEEMVGGGGVVTENNVANGPIVFELCTHLSLQYFLCGLFFFFLASAQSRSCGRTAGENVAFFFYTALRHLGIFFFFFLLGGKG